MSELYLYYEFFMDIRAENLIRRMELGKDGFVFDQL